MSRVTLRFRYNQIKISTSLIKDIGLPEYIHIYISKDSLKMYIRACEKDTDAFHVYRDGQTNPKNGFCISSLALMRILASVMGLNDKDFCCNCNHRQVDSETIEVDLFDYTPIEVRKM